MRLSYDKMFFQQLGLEVPNCLKLRLFEFLALYNVDVWASGMELDDLLTSNNALLVSIYGALTTPLYDTKISNGLSSKLVRGLKTLEI